MRKNIFTEIGKLYNDINCHYKHQKSENAKLAQILNQLKQEKINFINKKKNKTYIDYFYTEE